MAWVALFLGIALSIFLWHATARRTRQLADSRFAARAGELHGALRARLDAYSQILRGAMPTSTLPATPTASVLRTSTGPCASAATCRAIDLRLHPPRPGRRGHRTEAEVRGTTGFRHRPPGERDEYAVVTGVESQTPMNLRAIGSDSYATPNAHEA